MRGLGLLILIFVTMPISGCARGNVELLEVQLRAREDELLQAQSELLESQQLIGRLEREQRLLQTQLAESNNPQTLPETTRNLARIVSLKIDETLTGFLDQEPPLGEDTLNILLGPADAQGEIIKIEGSVNLELLDLSDRETGRKLGEWSLSPEKVAQNWHDGFLARGFQLTLPVELSSSSSMLTVRARWTTLDGRSFDAVQTLKRTVLLDSDESLPLPQVNSAENPFEAFPIEQAGFDIEQPAPSAPKLLPLDELLPPQ